MEGQRNYRICSKCIMDTSDPEIHFDGAGVCSHCHRYETTISSKQYRAKKKPGALDSLIKEIGKAGRAKQYDCIIGVSGGVDSTFTAYKVKELGLRPLAVHLDNGWNSELAERNIEKALRKLDIDFSDYTVNEREFRDLQLAFLKASTPDSEIPTDHAILAALYKVAAKEGVRYILSGHNTATEGGGVAAWSQGHGDWRYIKSVQKKFGSKRLATFPHYGPVLFVYYSLIKKISWIQILDYFDYDKKKAMKLLERELGWEYYGGKHYESIYTRFIQGYFLPKKFGFDKRRLHLSSLVWSGQMSREAALEEMGNIDYPQELQEEDREYVSKKLGISSEEFERIMQAPNNTFWDYPSYKKVFNGFPWLVSAYRSLKRR